MKTMRAMGEGTGGYQPQPYLAEADETVTCPACGAMNADDAKFCDQCGEELPDAPAEAYTAEADETIECPECGSMNEPDARFCDQCGYQLEGSEDVEASSRKPKGTPRNLRDVNIQPRQAPPPKDNLVRGGSKLAFRSTDDGGLGTLTGHFAVFNRWTEIDSWWEGNFMESIAPGSFRKTIAESKGVRCLFQHGYDPVVGDKPLGPITSLEEDSIGAAYDVTLVDTSYNRDLVPLLESGAINGASFRFRVVQEEVNNKPERSDYNPDGIPERTIKEVQLFEFGPVTFPAYPEATAGLRSLTDGFLAARRFGRGELLGQPELLEEMLERLAAGQQDRVERLVKRYSASRTPALGPPEPAKKATPPEPSREMAPVRHLALEDFLQILER